MGLVAASSFFDEAHPHNIATAKPANIHRFFILTKSQIGRGIGRGRTPAPQGVEKENAEREDDREGFGSAGAQGITPRYFPCPGRSRETEEVGGIMNDDDETTPEGGLPTAGVAFRDDAMQRGNGHVTE